MDENSLQVIHALNTAVNVLTGTVVVLGIFLVAMAVLQAVLLTKISNLKEQFIDLKESMVKLFSMFDGRSCETHRLRLDELERRVTRIEESR